MRSHRGFAQAKGRWRRVFEEAARSWDDPPARVLLRTGRGVHLLLGTADGGEAHVRLLPPDDREAGPAISATTCLDSVGGTRALPEAWRRAVAEVVRAQDGPDWAAFVAEAARRPGLKLAGVAPSERVTSGHELVIRLLEPCNAACDFCGCIGVSVDDAPTAEAVERRVRRGVADGLDTAVFTGGEPTLVANLPELVRLAKSLGMRTVALQTNGVRLADEALVRALAEAGLDRILLSMHGHTAARHDGILKLPGAFDAAWTGAAHCVRHGIRVALNHVTTTENVGDLPAYVVEVHDRFASFGVDVAQEGVSLTLSFVSPVGWALEHLEVLPRLRDAAPRLAEALDVADALGLDVHVPGLCGVPMCLLPGREVFFDEWHDPNPPPVLPTRRYARACDGCRWRSRCSGYWSVYLDRFGEDELGVAADAPRYTPPDLAVAEWVRAVVAEAGWRADPPPFRELARRLGPPWTVGALRRLHRAFPLVPRAPVAERLVALGGEALMERVGRLLRERYGDEGLMRAADALDALDDAALAAWVERELGT